MVESERAKKQNYIIENVDNKDYDTEKFWFIMN